LFFKNLPLAPASSLNIQNPRKSEKQGVFSFGVAERSEAVAGLSGQFLSK